MTRSTPSGSVVGRSLLAPPDIPADRLKVLRDAFNAMVKDPDFVADIKKVNASFDPLPGERVKELTRPIRSSGCTSSSAARPR